MIHYISQFVNICVARSIILVVENDKNIITILLILILIIMRITIYSVAKILYRENYIKLKRNQINISSDEYK